MKQNGVFRNFCFTINNFTDEDEKRLRELSSRYLIYGKEIGHSGTMHLQGYCELHKQVRFNSLKKLLPRAHIEKRKGTAQQASDYCRKEDKNPYVKGTISRPGKRNDIDQLYTLIKQGKTDYELQEHNPNAYCRYFRGLTRMRFNHHRHINKQWKPVEVIVMYGDPGSGKTKKAYEIDPDLYPLQQSKGQIWWDGYEGQKTVLIDDFYGWIPYSSLLRLLEGYPFGVQTKGGFTWKMWDRVIITSNAHPRSWYTFGLTGALERRLTKILHYEKEEVGVSITPNLCDSLSKGPQ